MKISRRTFVQLAASASALFIGRPGQAEPLPFAISEADKSFRPDLLPSAEKVWHWQTWMNNLGPKYTGNDAHRQFVEFLAKNLQSLGLEVLRDNYKFPRWEVASMGLKVTGQDGKAMPLAVTSYYPYSGQTDKGGVTGEVVYGGKIQVPSTSTTPISLNLPSDITGKIVYMDYEILPTPWNEWYKPWGFYGNTTFPEETSSLWGISTPVLTEFKKGGAIGVVFGWTNISDGAAAHQYTPFGRAMQDMPTLWVGQKSGTKLRNLAGTGAKATLTLEAQVFPDTSTDTLYTVLPGMSSDEVIIVNTHTDGPNATEENGGLGILALAEYFSKLPKSDRKRSIYFVLTTGHFAGAYVPSGRGFVQQHQDVIKKAVGSVTVEHLGCMEWLDNASGVYAATGKNELTIGITDYEPVSKIALDSLQGSTDKRAVLVKGRYFGEGSAFSRAGVPNLGYIPLPSYLVAGPPGGCIEKLSSAHMHGQIQVLAKAIHKMDGMSASDLKGGSQSTTG